MGINSSLGFITLLKRNYLFKKNGDTHEYPNKFCFLLHFEYIFYFFFPDKTTELLANIRAVEVHNRLMSFLVFRSAQSNLSSKNMKKVLKLLLLGLNIPEKQHKTDEAGPYSQRKVRVLIKTVLTSLF